MGKLELFKDYYKRYKIEDIICKGVSRYIFILESPHNDELKKENRHPVAGQSGIDMAKFMGIGDGNTSLGKYCKENVGKGISIINVSSAPLQEVATIKDRYKELINKVDTVVRLGYKSYGNHREAEINKIEKFILSDFKKRLEKLEVTEQTKIIICGKFAESYYDKLDMKGINKKNILCVPHPARNQWSKTIDNLNKLKQIKIV